MVKLLFHSEVGGHSENEDAYGFRSHPADENCFLVSMGDGQGGQSGGGPAARLACTSCLSFAASAHSTDLINPFTWNSILTDVDRTVAADAASGFTTLVAFGIFGGFIFGASNGDSAAILLNHGKRAEILTARQQKNPPIGSGAADIVPFHGELRPPWLVLAMTDGVWKYNGWDDVCVVLTLLVLSDS